MGQEGPLILWGNFIMGYSLQIQIPLIVQTAVIPCTWSESIQGIPLGFNLSHRLYTWEHLNHDLTLVHISAIATMSQYIMQPIEWGSHFTDMTWTK